MARAKQTKGVKQTSRPSSNSEVPAGPRVLNALVGLAVWIAGVLVSLAVGFGMIDGTLPIWGVPQIVTAIAGWIVVVLTVIGAILAIIDKLGR